MSRSRRWRTKNIESGLQARPAARAKMVEQPPNYKEWSQESLIRRVTQLEQELKGIYSSFTQPAPKPWKKPRAERQFDPSKYSTRLIALKLAYLGKCYNGFEYHANNATPFPTIEEELWKALNKARLIFPKDSNPLNPGEVNWEGCEYSKCGRTDKGVSAFGQVIGIRVRSNRPLRKRKDNTSISVSGDIVLQDMHNTLPRENSLELATPVLSPSRDLGQGAQELSIDDEDYNDALSFDPIADEIPYPMVLNRLLPPDIRILAWCPAPPLDFSARFSCRERQYKYFFTQPAFPPTPGHLEAETKMASGKKPMKDGWLDIEAMQEAAKQFMGVHDFRNFCKVDPSKQNFNYERRIFHSDIVLEDRTTTLGFLNSTSLLPPNPSTVDGSLNSSQYPKVYSFNLHGSAFLWHQVRHMVAILFLVGQGLESPSIVSELLDVEKNPRRPMYEIAIDTPLVLWNCIFPREGDEERKDAIEWLYLGDEAGKGNAKYGSLGLMEDLWKIWRERKIDEMLAGSLVNVVTAQGADIDSLTSIPRRGMKSQKVFDGGDIPRLQGDYIPVMKKPQMDSVEVINKKYAVRKGFEGSEDMKEQVYRRLKKSEGLVEDMDE